MRWFILLGLMSSSVAYGQSYDDFLAQKNRAFEDNLKKNATIIEQKNQAFNAHIIAQNQAFEEALARQWERFEAFAPKRKFSEPKPLAPPYYAPEQDIDRQPLAEPQNISTPTPPPLAPHVTAINFFGEVLTLPQVEQTNDAISLPETINLGDATGLANYWAQWSPYETRILQQMQSYITTMALDDWMSYQLALRIAQRVATAQPLALTWKLLNGLGYDARLARMGERVVILLAMQITIYGAPYMEIDKQRYYIFDGTNNRLAARDQIETYPGHIEGRRSFTQFSPGKINWTSNQDQLISRTLSHKDNAIDLQFDARDVLALASYPQFEFSFYFANPTRAIDYQDLRTQINGDNLYMRAENLLRLIQFGIEYQTDEQQFGREYYMFGEETLFYPYADCEDRSILYGGLLKTHLDIDFIVLHYPGHLAIAVDLPGEGDSITYKGRRYLVADPTYIGAPIGKAMQKDQADVVFASRDL